MSDEKIGMVEQISLTIQLFFHLKHLHMTAEVFQGDEAKLRSCTMSLPEHSTLSKQARSPTHIHRIGTWILPCDKGSGKEFEVIFNIPQGAKGFQLWEPASKSPISQRPKEVISCKSEEGSFPESGKWMMSVSNNGWVVQEAMKIPRETSAKPRAQEDPVPHLPPFLPCFNKVRKRSKMGEEGQKQKSGREKKEPALFLNFLFAKGPSWGKI